MVSPATRPAIKAGDWGVTDLTNVLRVFLSSVSLKYVWWVEGVGGGVVEGWVEGWVEGVGGGVGRGVVKGWVEGWWRGWVEGAGGRSGWRGGVGG